MDLTLLNIQVQKNQQTATLINMLLPYICKQQICPSNATYFTCSYQTTMSVYTLCELTAIKSFTTSTVIHTFNIIGI